MAVKKIDPGRRRFFGVACRGVLGVAGLGLAGRAGAVPDPVVPTGDKVPKPTVAYQDTPKWGQVCRTCRYWEGDKTCRRVRGEISPAGWCMMFTKG